MLTLIENGFYIISDEYFEKFDNGHLMNNKGKKRPHYFCFKDTESHLFWLIPVSSQIDVYRKRIEDIESKYGKGNCDLYAEIEIAGKPSIFIFTHIIPIIPKYIDYHYSISQIPLILKNEHTINLISKKAKKVLSLLRKNVKLSKYPPDIKTIEIKLLEDLDK